MQDSRFDIGGSKLWKEGENEEGMKRTKRQKCHAEQKVDSSIKHQ
jgi:hypothetical protein